MRKALKVFALSAFFSPGVSAQAPVAGIEAEHWSVSGGGCRLQADLAGVESVSPDYVYDGDTVRLSDGRRVRLLGINTPELGRDGDVSQPYAEEARRDLREALANSESWFLLPVRKGRDRYGRVLAYLLNDRGEALGSSLVRQGAAFWVAKGADVSHVKCFGTLENLAREQGMGVWGYEYWKPLRAREVSPQKLGFRLVEGVVTKVDGAGAMYVELDERMVLRIPSRILAPAGNWKRLLGRNLQVRGWVLWRQLSEKQKARGFRHYLINVSAAEQIQVGN